MCLLRDAFLVSALACVSPEGPSHAKEIVRRRVRRPRTGCACSVRLRALVLNTWLYAEQTKREDSKATCYSRHPYSGREPGLKTNVVSNRMPTCRAFLG